MNCPRRNFLKHSSLVTCGLFFCDPLKALSSISEYRDELTGYLNTVNIIHTNDLHNTINPLATGRTNGYGGLKNIEYSLQDKSSDSLLLDAGDFLDDRVSLEEHRKMIQYMNRLGYHAAAIGNRELSKGQDYLADLLPMMKFALVNCNYSFSNTYLKNHIVPYQIIKSGRYKIGVTGVGVNPEELKGIIWSHPYDKANSIAGYLKKQRGCDLVICLSHLGYVQQDGIPHNVEFARYSRNIDVIISGHSDAIKPNILVLRNEQKQEVIVSHGGEGGLLMKQITFSFNDRGEKHRLAYKNFVPGLQLDRSAYQEIKEIMG